VLPKPNFVPTNTYQAKKLINPLTMGVEQIHLCPNHCILYRGVFKDLMNCPNYGASRYKINKDCSEDTNTRKKRKKGEKENDASHNVEEEISTLAVDDTNQRRIPALVMWYLSPIDRMMRLFSNPRDSELMRWWALDERKKDDKVLRHPSDAK
jgi:hypothetical protein